MRTFTDNTGRTWSIVINVNQLRAVRENVPHDGKGFDLLGGPSHDITDVCRLLSEDMELLVNVVYVLCRDQATKQNITDVQFGEALVGDAIDGATQALLNGIVDFFPQSLRTQYQRMLEIATEARDQIDKELMEKLNTITTKQIVKELTSGNTSTSLRGKRASSRGHTRSVNSST